MEWKYVKPLKDNSIILVTPNLDKNEFNVFNLKFL